MRKISGSCSMPRKLAKRGRPREVSLTAADELKLRKIFLLTQRVGLRGGRGSLALAGKIFAHETPWFAERMRGQCALPRVVVAAMRGVRL